MDHTFIKSYQSPNYSKRKSKIKYIILHATVISLNETLEKFMDKNSNVSSHLVIDENGEIYEMVSPKKTAWHAGISYWRNNINLNDTSIGIELVHLVDQDNYQLDFPKEQINSLINVCKYYSKKYSIDLHNNVLGHSDIAPWRLINNKVERAKTDPGHKFPWEELAKYGIGRWYDQLPKLNQEEINIKECQKYLKKIGYHLDITGKLDLKTKFVIEAFKDHYLRPYNKVDRLFDDRLDKKTMQIISALFHSR